MKIRIMATAMVVAGLAVAGVAKADTGNNHEQESSAPRT